VRKAARIAAIALLTVLVAACGGESTAEETQPAVASSTSTGSTKEQQRQIDGAPPTVHRLDGTWSQIGDKLLVRFRHDGTFAIDTSDLDAPYAFGTYVLDGSEISFKNADAGPCTRSDWTWEAGITEKKDRLDDELHILFVEGGCLVPRGTEWRFARVS